MNRRSRNAFAMGLTCALFLSLGCGRYGPPIRPPAPEPAVTPGADPATRPAPDEPAPEGWEFEDEPGSETP